MNQEALHLLPYNSSLLKVKGACPTGSFFIVLVFWGLMEDLWYVYWESKMGKNIDWEEKQ